MNTKSPRFKIHKLHQMFDTVPNVMEFWIYCGDNGIKTYNGEFFSKLNGDVRGNVNFQKMFKELQDKESTKPFIKQKLPKYIVSFLIKISKYDHPTNKLKSIEYRNKLLDFLITMFGANSVEIFQTDNELGFNVEVKLFDDGDLSAFNMYSSTSPELFFY